MYTKILPYWLILTIIALMPIISNAKENTTIQFTNCVSDESIPIISKAEYQDWDLIIESLRNKNLTHGGYCHLPDGSTWTVVKENSYYEGEVTGFQITFIHLDANNNIIKEISGHSIPMTNGESPSCELVFMKGNQLYALCDNDLFAELGRSYYGLIDVKNETGMYLDYVPNKIPNSTVEAIAYLKELKIIEGDTQFSKISSFYPQNTINRAEFTKIIMGAVQSSVMVSSNEPSDDCTITLTDIIKGSWYEPFVTKAFCNNIINGYPDATFKPSNTINAAEMYKIVASAFKLPVQQSMSATWFTPYEYALQSIDAIPASITSADQLITRGEMAEMVYRVMEAQK